jgi:hypothetical protein
VLMMLCQEYNSTDVLPAAVQPVHVAMSCLMHCSTEVA